MKNKMNEIMNKSIEMQDKLFARLRKEIKIDEREWTAHQIAYQKKVYKSASFNLGGGCVVDGIGTVDDQELETYYTQLVT